MTKKFKGLFAMLLAVTLLVAMLPAMEAKAARSFLPPPETYGNLRAQYIAGDDAEYEWCINGTDSVVCAHYNDVVYEEKVWPGVFAGVPENTLAANLKPGTYEVLYRGVACGCKLILTSSAPTAPTIAHEHDNEHNNFAAGSLASSPDQLLNAVLTAQEKADGGNYRVWLKLDKKEINNINDDEKQKINAKLPGGFTVGTYLDVNLLKQGPGQDNGTLVPKTNEKVTIKLTVPSDLQKAGRTYKMIRIHDEVADVLDTECDANFNLTFATDGFSTYALAYSDYVAPAAVPVAPKTGESNSAWLILMAACLGVLMTARKREDA